MSDEAKPEDGYTVVPHTKEVPHDVAAANWRRIARFTLRYRGDSVSSMYGLAAVSQVLWIGAVEETDRQDQVGSNADLGIDLLEETVSLCSTSFDTCFELHQWMLTQEVFRCQSHTAQIVKPQPYQ